MKKDYYITNSFNKRVAKAEQLCLEDNEIKRLVIRKENEKMIQDKLLSITYSQ